MGPYIVLAVIGAAAVAAGGCFSAYHLYLLVQVDAKCRGLKHPKLWGMASASGNNSSGLLIYLAARRKYPVRARSAEQVRLMERCKRKIGAGLILLSAGAIVCVLCIFLSGQV